MEIFVSCSPNNNSSPWAISYEWTLYFCPGMLCKNKKNDKFIKTNFNKCISKLVKLYKKATRRLASYLCIGKKTEASVIGFCSFLVFHVFLFNCLKAWVCTFYSDPVCFGRGAWLSFRQHAAPWLDEVTIKLRPASQARKYWFSLIG